MSVEHIETSFDVPRMPPPSLLRENLVVPLADVATIAIGLDPSEFTGFTEAELTLDDKDVIFSLGQAFKCKRGSLGLYTTTPPTRDMRIAPTAGKTGGLDWHVTVYTPGMLPPPNSFDVDVFTDLANLIREHGIRAF